MGALIPAAALEEEAIHVAPRSRGLGEVTAVGLAIVAHLHVKVDAIDGILVGPGIVLHHRSEEGLREEETRDPEGDGMPVLVPQRKEPYPIVQIFVPSCQRFQGEKAHSNPAVGNGIHEEAFAHVLQLLRHHNETLDGSPEERQLHRKQRQEPIVLGGFLLDHRVPGFLVHCWEPLFKLVQVELLGSLRNEFGGQLIHDLFWRLATPAAAPATARGSQVEDVLEQCHGLGLCARDLAVLVKPEDLRGRHDGQAPQVGQESILVGGCRAVEQPTRRELVSRPFEHHVGAHEDLDHAFNQDLVFLVGDAAAIVDLCAEELQYLVRNLFVVVQKVLQLSAIGHQVLRREVVRDVPTDGTELPTILTDRVEEAETKEQASVRLRLLTITEQSVVTLAHGPQDIRPEPLWRFVGHLHAVLQ
mmetsp:Transcript_92576/g.215096  ORF Transcript_92576/g.215096 Transcript_92576/m.215096 type:complete len:416 (-) Transcript_92576:1301-2548(-)